MDDWIPDVSELDPLEDDEPSTNSKDDHPIPEHIFQLLEKTIAAGEFDQKSQNSLKKKKNWTSKLEYLQCHEVESGNNQGRNSCIYCILCTAVLHSPDLASGVNWKDSLCWGTKQ